MTPFERACTAFESEQRAYDREQEAQDASEQHLVRWMMFYAGRADRPPGPPPPKGAFSEVRDLQ